MSNLVNQVFRFVLKLVFGLLAALFAISLLVAALITLAVGLLVSLFTGRKPAPAMMFGRFQQFSKDGIWAGHRPMQAAPKAASGQIVDVEVREIPGDRRS